MEGVIAYVTGFAGNFAPRGWAFCQGQIVNIQSNTALFSLMGTYYGGNGTTTFGLPDLRGRAIVGAGQGPGLSDYSIGEQSGVESTTILTSQMPFHGHAMSISITPGSASTASTSSPANTVYAPAASGGQSYAGSSNGNMQAYSLALTTGLIGSNIPFSNRNPFLALNHIICLQGVYPARN